MSEGFSNEVVGGTTLVRPAIKSPNYVPATTGWSVNKDGSAEFNNLTVRGTFNGNDYLISSAGAFFYSSAPALGNLILSITQFQGTDAEGNLYLAGTTSYTNQSGTFYASNSTGINTEWWTAPAAGGPWTLLQFLGVSTGGPLVTGGPFLITSNLAANLPLLEVEYTTAAPSVPPVQLIGATAGDRVLGIEVIGDANFRLRIDTNGTATWVFGGTGASFSLGPGSNSLLQLLGADLAIGTAGRGLQIKEGTGGRVGVATLVGGTVTVANTTVTGATRIFLTREVAGGTVGDLRVGGRVAGTSFTISSAAGTDTSTVAYLLVEPA